jgi:predicted chitinase
MTEHVLPYDHNVTPQEKFYDCGPASTQVVLNGRGVIASEDELIPQEGTTENGTNDINNVVPVLNKYLPEAGYQAVHMPNDPPTQAQKNALWQNIVTSINSGHGLVANIVAPPSNYPRGVKGSASPSYAGGTVFHYIPLMGYDDNPQLRAVWVADPGFRPFGYWVSFDQLATLIPPKGYAYSTATVVDVPTTPPAPPVEDAPEPPAPGAETVLAAATGLSLDRARELLSPVSAGLSAAQCTNVNRIAMFLAQTGEESAGFDTTEEYASGAEYEGREDLGNTVPGDGVRFKGRTAIQITGRHNYGMFSQWAYAQGLVDSPSYFVEHPEELSDWKWAFVGAAWYWTVERPDINSLCDAGDVVSVTRRINGGTNGLDERIRRWHLALGQGDALLELLTTQEEDSFMPALNTDEQRELLELARQQAAYRRESRSRLRWPHQGEIDTCAGFAWSGEAWGHESQTEKLAVEYGDPVAIANLYAVATTDEDGRDADKELAEKMLEKCDPVALNRANAQILAWLHAEQAAA